MSLLKDLVRWELKHFFKRKSFVFLIIAIIGVGLVINLFLVIDIKVTTENGVRLKGFQALKYDKEFCEKYEGIINEEKWESINDVAANSTHIQKVKTAVEQGFPSKIESVFLLDADNLHYKFSTPYEIFIFSFKIVSLFFLCFTIYLSWFIFVRDRIYKTNEFLFSSKYGTTKQITSKIIFLLITTTISFLLITTILFVFNGILNSGYSGGDGSIQLGTENLYTMSPYILTWFKMTLLTVLFSFLGNLFSVCLLLLLTSLIKIDFVSLISSIILVIFPSFLNKITIVKLPFFIQWLCGFPTNIFNFNMNIVVLNPELIKNAMNIILMIFVALISSCTLFFFGKYFWKKQKI